MPYLIDSNLVFLAKADPILIATALAHPEYTLVSHEVPDGSGYDQLREHHRRQSAGKFGGDGSAA
jgi:hypothetical protein